MRAHEGEVRSKTKKDKRNIPLQAGRWRELLVGQTVRERVGKKGEVSERG